MRNIMKNKKEQQMHENESNMEELELSEEELEGVSGGTADPERVKEWLEKRKK